MTELIEACKINDVSAEKLNPIDVEGVPLMITKIDGNYVVFSRICTHREYDLTQGHYSDGYVTCMLHTSVFDLTDEGEAMNAPATEALDFYEVVVKGDTIFIRI